MVTNTQHKVFIATGGWPNRISTKKRKGKNADEAGVPAAASKKCARPKAHHANEEHVDRHEQQDGQRERHVRYRKRRRVDREVVDVDAADELKHDERGKWKPTSRRHGHERADSRVSRRSYGRFGPPPPPPPRKDDKIKLVHPR